MKFVITDGRPWYFQMMSGWLIVAPVFYICTIGAILGFPYPLILKFILVLNLSIFVGAGASLLHFIAEGVWKV